MSNQSPFQLLGQMQEKAVQLAEQNVVYAVQSAGTKNIAYQINGVNFYCQANDVKEVSACEYLMVVPQTKRWMRGLVNSKGVLYSVTDLALFGGDDRPIQENKGHLLLLNEEGTQSALLVSRVIGFRYFDDSASLDEKQKNAELPEGLSIFVTTGHHVDGENWYQLDVGALLSSEQFREVQ